MALESILKRDRLVVLASLVLVIAAGLTYLLTGAGTGMPAHLMTGIPGQAADSAPERWTWPHTGLIFAMWLVMMVAMMLPGAAPVLLLVASLNRRLAPDRMPYANVAWFALGYVLVWALASGVLVAAQKWLVDIGSLSAMMQVTGGKFAGGFLLAAGAWQLTPMKTACLDHCRSPAQFLARSARKGALVGIAVGFQHGAVCLGCCAFLMGLLFVGGVMNLYWIVGLAAYVLAEKVAPGAAWLARAAGIMLAGWGLALLYM